MRCYSVEMYSLDLAASYQHAFVYIRQLAIHLRNAITTKTKDAHRGVYNWQYINCLRVWAKALALHGSTPDAPLYPLVYPLIQVCLGVLDLLPASRYFPLKFIVSRIVNQVGNDLQCANI
jgi:nucleolar complex protein 2